MAALQMNQSTIAAIADRVVQARRLYGPDSAYIIGLFTGLELAHEGDDGDALRAKVQEQVLRLESGKGGGKGSGSGGGSKSESPARQESGTPGPQGGELAENTWVRGNVKWFNNDKGYGFISTAANTDVFVHWRDISSWDRSLSQGDEVEFMVTKTAKGFQAINVMKPGSEGEGGGGGGAETAASKASPSAPSAPSAAPQSSQDDDAAPATPAPETEAAAQASTAEAAPAAAAAPATEAASTETEQEATETPVAGATDEATKEAAGGATATEGGAS